MVMKKILLFAVLTLFCLSTSLLAEDGDAGYAGSFLQVPIGARPTAMGGAFISISNDASGSFYNPAGMSIIKKSIFATSYRAMQLDRKLGYTAILFPTQGNSVLGFSWLYAGSGSVDARNDDGDLLGNTLEQNNHQISILFSKRFEKYLSLGFKGSYLYSKFAEMSVFSVGIDLGATLYISRLFSREKRDLMSIQDIQVGLVVRNLAANFKWNNDNYLAAHSGSAFGGSDHIDDFPVEIGIGGSARFFNRKLLLSSDIVKNSKENIILHAGGEYFITKQFAARVGYTDRSLTTGFGYVFNLDKFGLVFDYAYSSEKVGEGSEHIFSFDILF
ncbi:MAG TPA: PorV/PorQ family protein [candidate division Zixibacteria bacterium]|nr:PorV/PorQ family protein [candidate division Zixibacteria bacterium]